MNELRLAAFAAETGSHVVAEPRGEAFARFRREFDGRSYSASLERAGLRFLARSSADFPPLLRAVHDPPVGLFVRGSAPIDLLSRPAVAIVGARSCSTYGAHVARMLGRELAAAGLVIVSGLARGIDGEAHRGALEASGATVAVLGCGVDRDYPASHARLAADVAKSGAVVSEYARGVEPAPWRFPARNRIIAGLAEAAVVVEARERSGALITADFALEEGRDVFAVPGEITSALSAGTNRLLQLGAAPLTRAEDVLELFGLGRREPVPIDVGAAAVGVLAALRDAPASADALARSTGLGAAELSAALTELELAGVACQGEGVYRAVG